MKNILHVSTLVIKHSPIKNIKGASQSSNLIKISRSFNGTHEMENMQKLIKKLKIFLVRVDLKIV
jgi:hypothetical protein